MTSRNRYSRIVICIASIVIFAVVILFALDLLAPRLINMDSSKQMIQTLVAERTGGTIDYDRIYPSIFPRPGIDLEGVHLAVPGSAELTAKSVKLYPKVLPLLWGRVVISKLLVMGPELSIAITPETPGTTEAPTSFWYVQKSIEAMLAPLSVNSPDLDIVIREGRLDIAWGTAAKFHFRDLSTYLTSTGRVINMHVSGSSNFSKSMVLTANIDPDSSNVQGKITLEAIKPSVLIGAEPSTVSAALATTESDLSFTFVLSEQKLIIANLTGKAGQSVFSSLNAEIDMSKHEPYLYITTASMNISLSQVRQAIASTGAFEERMKSLRSVDGTIVVTSALAEGPLLSPSAWDFHLNGEASDVSIDDARLPGPVAVSGGTLMIEPDRLTFEDARTNMLDASLNVSGLLSNYMRGPFTAETTFTGDAGAETVQWVNEVAKVPPQFRVEQPVTIRHADVKWNGESTVSVDAGLSFPDGPDLALEVSRTPSMIAIKRLHVQDDTSNADLSYETGEKERHLKFSGSLTQETVSKLIPSAKKNGWVQGNFEVRFPKEGYFPITAGGELNGGGFSVPRDTGIPLIINTVSLSADKGVIFVNSSDLGLGEKRLTARGNITSSGRDFILDMHVATDSVNWNDIAKNFLHKKLSEAEEIESPDAPHVRGTVVVSSGSFTYKRYRWSPVRATVSLEPKVVRVDVPEAVICDISTPGTVTVEDGEVGLDFRGSARKGKVKNSLNCLLGQDVDITGKFDLKGHITAKSKAGSLRRSMEGKVKLTARDGIIYRYPLFSRIFSIVNVLEVFKGRYDDIISKGFPYDAITIKGDIKKGRLKLREASMDGSTMKIAGDGEVDLKDKDTDLTLIVSPLRTIDSIVEQIPIIRDITAGTLISIAMKVTGKIDDPQIITLPPSAVGEGIVGMVKRLFKLPLKLFEPEKSDKKRK